MSSKGFGSLLTLWSAIRGKPSAFPPAAHRHPWSQIDDKPTTFAPTLPIAQADVIGLVNALAGKATPTDIANAINALKNGAPLALDTLNEIAERFALEDTEQEAMLAAIAARLRIDAAVGYTSAQQAFGRGNLGLGSAATRADTYFATAAALAAIVSSPFKDIKSNVATNASGVWTRTYPANFWTNEPSVNVNPISTAVVGQVSWKTTKTLAANAWTVRVDFSLTASVLGLLTIGVSPGICRFDYSAAEANAA